MKTILSHLRPVVVGLALVSIGHAAGGGGGDEVAGQVFQMRPNEKSQLAIPYIGVTGIQARVHPGLVVKVEGTIDGSPSAGKFAVDEILTGVNGVTFDGNNLYVVLGEALTAAEAADGKLIFDVLSPDGKATRQQLVEVPVLGTYSDTWPLDCPKADKIVKNAAEFFSRPEMLKDHGVPGALTVLFLLSTGDDQYLPAVKSYFDAFPKEVEKIGGHTWNNGYNGIACAEYYLRTGDQSVLPILQFFCDDAKRRQKFGVGWIHWGDAVRPRYVAGGLMNPAGAQVLTTLLLAKECGLNVDEKTLLGSLRYFYRFAGKGTVPYGDHRGEGALGSNGKDGMIAAAMQIACGSSGDVTIYEQARNHLALSMVQSYPGLCVGHADNGRGDAIWRGVVTSYMADLQPELYREAMDRLTWWHDLSRSSDGSLGFATLQWGEDITGSSGAGVGLSYTAPRKTLRITGAPRTKFSKDYELPAQLWGTEADLAFHRINHNPKYFHHGDAEPTHVPYWTFGSAYWTPKWDPQVHTKAKMRQNVYHSNYMIRAQAAKAMLVHGMISDLEKLLSDPDPRVRRAGIDGLIDYRFWFNIGKSPIKPEQFTPRMLTEVKHMLGDPDESLYVVDGALSLLSLAPAADIKACLPLVEPWIGHDDWWLREGAFNAMSGMAKDPALYLEVLPKMMQLFRDEYHTMPRQRMLDHLNKVLKQQGRDSAIGRMILAGFEDSVKGSEIIGGLRAPEGAYNVMQAATACLGSDPGTAVAVATMMLQRMESFDTESLVALVGTPGSAEDAPKTGLYPAMANLKGKDKEMLRDLLAGDYCDEFLRRLKAEEGPFNHALVDTILDLKRLKGDVTGWQPIGKVAPPDIEWKFTTFDPQREEDEMPARERKRFRRVQQPKELTDWQKPAFDDSGWRSGKGPIGKGPDEFRGTRIANNADWGEGEFIVMRTTFNVDALDYDAYRIRILARQGYDVYLNGVRVLDYVWWKDLPSYRPFELSPEQVKLLKKGTNVLAAYGNIEFHKKTAEPTGQMDLYIEGLRMKDVVE